MLWTIPAYLFAEFPNLVYLCVAHMPNCNKIRHDVSGLLQRAHLRRLNYSINISFRVWAYRGGPDLMLFLSVCACMFVSVYACMLVCMYIDVHWYATVCVAAH